MAREKSWLSGLTSFFSVSYILMINSLILAEAGIPPELSVFGTIFVSILGTVIIGNRVNVPIVITTGMGVNSFFTYTLVYGFNMTWQEALAVSFVAGICYMVVMLTPLIRYLQKEIPEGLKHGITAGIGCFLILIGAEQGGIILRGEHTLLMRGVMSDPALLLTMVGLLITIILWVKNVPGSLLIGILTTTALAHLLGWAGSPVLQFSIQELKHYPNLLGQLDFSLLGQLKFWLAVFSLWMILVFETLGLYQGLLPDASDETIQKACLWSSIPLICSSLLGTSPTIPAAESATGIQAGGKNGQTAYVVSLLFLASLLILPLLSVIPQSALAPVMIMTGILMMGSLSEVNIGQSSEWIPVALMMTMMAFTMSIADGMAFGFITYPILRKASGKDVSYGLWGLMILFIIYLLA